MTPAKTIIVCAVLMLAEQSPKTIEAAPPKSEVSRKVAVETLKGNIDSVQTESFFLRHAMRDKTATEKIVVTSETRITIDGTKATLADLKPGYYARTIGTRPIDPLVADSVDVASCTDGEQKEAARQVVPVLFAAGGGGGGGDGSGRQPVIIGPQPPTDPTPDTPPGDDPLIPCITLPCGITIPVLDCLESGLIDIDVINDVLSCLPALELELLCQQDLGGELITEILTTTDGKLDLAVEILIAKIERVCLILECVDGVTDPAVEKLHAALAWKLQKVSSSLQSLLQVSGEVPEALIQKLCVDLRAASAAALSLLADTTHAKLDSLKTLATSLLNVADCSEALLNLPPGDLLRKKQELVSALIGCAVPCDGLVTNLVEHIDPLKSTVASKLRHLADVLKTTFYTADGVVEGLQAKLIADLLECADVLELLCVTSGDKLDGVKTLLSQKLGMTAQTLKAILAESGQVAGGLKSLLVHKLEWASQCILDSGVTAVGHLTAALTDIECICGLLQGDLIQELLIVKHELIQKLLTGTGPLTPGDCELLSLLIKVDPDLNLQLSTNLSHLLSLNGDLSSETRIGLLRIVGVDLDVDLLADARLCELLHSGGALDVDLSLRLAELLCQPDVLEVDLQVTLAGLLNPSVSSELTLGEQTWADLMIALQGNFEHGETLVELSQLLKICALDLDESLIDSSTELVHHKLELVRHLLQAATLCDQLAGVLHKFHDFGDLLELQKVHYLAGQLLSCLDAALKNCDRIATIPEFALEKAFVLLETKLSLLKGVIAELCDVPATAADTVFTKLDQVVDLAEFKAGFLVFHTIRSLEATHELLAYKLALAAGLTEITAETVHEKLALAKRLLAAKLIELSEAKREIVSLLIEKTEAGDLEIGETLHKLLDEHSLLCLKTAELCETIVALQGQTIDNAEALLAHKLRMTSVLLKHVLTVKGETLITLKSKLSHLLCDCLPEAEHLIEGLVFKVGHVKAGLLQVLLTKAEKLSIDDRLLAAKYLLAQAGMTAAERIKCAAELLVSGELTSDVKQSLHDLLKAKLLTGLELKHALLKTLTEGTELEGDISGIVTNLLCCDRSLGLSELTLLSDVIRSPGSLTETLKTDLKQLLATKLSESFNQTEVLLSGPLHEAFAHHHVLGEVKGVLAPTAPPVPLTELLPQLPKSAEGFSWISGYWHFNDLTGGFEWISGTYRQTPHGRKWMSGLWQKVEGGYLRTPGAWVPESLDIGQVQLLPHLPGSVTHEAVDLREAKGKLRLPGQWMHKDGEYAWQKGRWITGSEDWVWTPARHVVTEKGTFLVDGFWDHPFAKRGFLFAPLKLKPGESSGTVYHLAQTVMIPERMMLHLFSREGHHGYLFGNFYDSSFVDHGLLPWFQTGGHDHLLAFEAARVAEHGVDIFSRLENWHHYFLTHPESRPPRTLREFAAFVERNKGNPYALQSVLATDTSSIGVLDTEHLALDDGLLNSTYLSGANSLDGSLLGTPGIDGTLGGTLSLLNLNSTLSSTELLSGNLLSGVTGSLGGTLGGVTNTLGGVTGSLGGVTGTLGGTTGSLGGTLGGATSTLGGATGGGGLGGGTLNGVLGGGGGGGLQGLLGN